MEQLTCTVTQRENTILSMKSDKNNDDTDLKDAERELQQRDADASKLKHIIKDKGVENGKLMKKVEEVLREKQRAMETDAEKQ